MFREKTNLSDKQSNSFVNLKQKELLNSKCNKPDIVDVHIEDHPPKKVSKQTTVSNDGLLMEEENFGTPNAIQSSESYKKDTWANIVTRKLKRVVVTGTNNERDTSVPKLLGVRKSFLSMFLG